MSLLHSQNIFIMAKLKEKSYRFILSSVLTLFSPILCQSFSVLVILYVHFVLSLRFTNEMITLSSQCSRETIWVVERKRKRARGGVMIGYQTLHSGLIIWAPLPPPPISHQQPDVSQEEETEEFKLITVSCSVSAPSHLVNTLNHTLHTTHTPTHADAQSHTTHTHMWHMHTRTNMYAYECSQCTHTHIHLGVGGTKFTFWEKNQQKRLFCWPWPFPSSF